MDFRLVLILIIAGATTKSFVSTAPADNGLQASQDVSDEVQQLEELRKEHDKPILEHSPPEQNPNSMSDVDSESKHASEKSPSALASKSKDHSAIFRHRGITEAKKSHLEYEPQKQDQNEEFAKFSGVQYSPADLAEYVFRTGDEEGVALAVEELVREGMMGRTDAINYLQDVKENLMYLKDQYEQARRLEDMKSRSYPKPQISQRLQQIPREQFVSQLDTEKREPKLPDQYPRTMTTAEPPQQVVTASTAAPKMSTRSDSTTPGPLADIRDTPGTKDIEGLNNPNPFYDEYTLEEVIYQFAKYMFTQSMSGGDQTAEDTLARLINFLENKVDNKRISREMKEKILEIVSASLVDSLREYPGLLTEDRIPADNDQRAIYHPGDNVMVTDKRSLQEKVHQKPLTGAIKTRQLTASNSGSTENDRTGLAANAQALQTANSSPIRSKRT